MSEFADAVAGATRAFRNLYGELSSLRRQRAWWAQTDPVAYLWLRRAEQRRAIVPWT